MQVQIASESKKGIQGIHAQIATESQKLNTHQDPTDKGFELKSHEDPKDKESKLKSHEDPKR